MWRQKKEQEIEQRRATSTQHGRNMAVVEGQIEVLYVAASILCLLVTFACYLVLFPCYARKVYSVKRYIIKKRKMLIVCVCVCVCVGVLPTIGWLQCGDMEFMDL